MTHTPEPTHDYDDIIDLPHHVSDVHPQMPMIERAAQFSPFAALSGYDDAVDETARPTVQKAALTAESKAAISAVLSRLQRNIASRPPVSVNYFKPDGLKAGGAYVTVTGRLKKIDEFQRTIALADGGVIPIDDIYSIDAVDEES